MIPNRRGCAAFAMSLMMSACATTSPLVRQECYNPDAQLASLMQPLEALRAKGCVAGDVQRGGSECERLRREIQRLAVVCPQHVPTLMATAVIAYDEQRPAESQQILDQILARPRSYPDAAVLRAQIALEEGNVPFALRLLEQRIKLAPDHSGLRETYAAALYFDGKLAEARGELAIAEALGAPRWRIAYHLGLIEEASGRRDEASRYYSEALEGNPGWAPAASRLRALRASDSTRP
jgi:tetratricopeptide (TPR) repeat protein